MKKRLISMLLVAVLAVSLLAGYSLSANAETVSYSTMTYQMKSGDYVLRICQNLGLNYYTCKPAIMKLNNITDNQWNKLAVGRLLTLPSTDADAIVISTGHGSTATATSSVTTPVATVTTASTKPKSSTTYSQSAIDTAITKDTCWWYMVPYKLAMGETATDACNVLGVSYSKWKGTLEKINNISNWNSIPAGTTLWLGTLGEPAAGTNCICVYRHVMQSGETAYGVVSDRGLDYNAIKPMLQILNEDHKNLASFKPGDSFYYPVATTIALPSDTTSDNKTITTNSDGTTTVTQTYKLTSAIDTGAANVEFYVNGVQVKEAKAGDTVNVSINTKAGRAAKNVVVKFANGQADLKLESFSFTMPKCDIQIDADVMKGHAIELVSNYIGKAVTLVDGVSMNAAATGAGVIVASNDPALVPTEVYISYKTLNGIKREAVPNIDQGFVMPDADVKVEVTLEAVPTYPIYVIDDANNNFGANGSFTLQVNGNDVTKAAKGAEVAIKAKPNDGYTIGGIVVQRHTTGQNVNAFNNTFIMPADAVDVQVIFQAKDNNNILINPIQGGQFYATTQANASLAPTTIANRNAWAIREAQTNTRVYLNWVPEDAADNASYIMETRPAFADSYVVIRNSDGLRVPVTIDGTGVWFRMPAGGVTVTGAVRSAQRLYTGSVFLDGNNVAQYQDISLYLRADSEQQRNEYQITNDGTAPQFQADVGEYVNASYSIAKNIALDRYEVWVNGAVDPTLSAELQKNSCFLMPTLAQVADANTVFEVRAYFVSDIVKLAAADIKVTGVGTVGMVDGATAFAVSGVKVGDPFWISVAAADGYIFDDLGVNPAENISSIHVYRKDTGGEIFPVAGPILDPNGTGSLLFGYNAMPADGVTVEVVFEKLGYVMNVTTVDENGNPLTGGSYVKITRNNTDTIIDNSFTVMSVEYGDSISVDLTEVGKSQYEFVSTEVNSFISKNKSFKVSGDNATNPINLIITLKSKSVTASKNPIALNAAPTNDARGNVNCVITASPTGYSTPDTNTYVDKAYAGDTVAIIPQAGIGYYTDADHVIVSVDGGRMDLGETTINGQTAYTFTMPSSDYRNIRVEFLPIEYNLTIKVIDSANKPTEVINMIKASYSSGGTDPDVMLSDSYRPVPYGSTVYVNLSTYAKNLGVSMDKTTDKPAVAPGNLTVPDKNKKTVDNTLENSGDGVKFIMPAGDCTLTVYLLDVPAELTPVDVTLPTKATVTDPASHGDLTLQYSYEDGTVITGTAKSGETVKVEVSAGLSAGEKLNGPIDIYDGTTLVAQVENGGTFTVPNPTGTLTAEAKVSMKQYKVTINTTGMLDSYTFKVTVDGASQVTITSGTTLSPNVEHGKDITLDLTGCPNVDSVDYDTGISWSSPKLTITPSDLDDGDETVITINFEVPEYNLTGTKVEFYDSNGSEITSGKAKEGETITIKGVPSNDFNYATEIEVTIGTDPAKTIKDGDSIVVTGDVTASLKTAEPKVITVNIVYEDAPSGLDAVVKYNSTTVSPTGIKVQHSDGDAVEVILNAPDGYRFVLPTSPTEYSVSGTDYDAIFTIDWAEVENNDTINIELPFKVPERQLSETNSGQIEYYTDAAGKTTPVTSIVDGGKIYVKATPNDSSIYVKSVTVLGTKISSPNANGLYGPFTITADVDHYVTDIDLEAAAKVVTLKFNYQGEAASKVALQWKGGDQNPNTSFANVSKNGDVKIGDVKLVIPDSSVKFGTVIGTGVTVTKPDDYTAEFAFDDAAFKNIANGATISITVYVE